MTTADRAHRRRARRAIYGPPVAAILGFALLAGGASGLVVHERSRKGSQIERAPSSTATTVRVSTSPSTSTPRPTSGG